jgi:hypothetical protein
MPELDERAVTESEGAVKAVTGIAESWNVGETISLEPTVGLGFILHVYERDLRSQREKIGAHVRDVFQRLPAERSTEVAKKDQEDRTAIRELPDRGRDHDAVATAVRAHFSSLRASL